MVPPAPPRLSITSCWPSSSESVGVTMRAMVSSDDPADWAAITRTGRLG